MENSTPEYLYKIVSKDQWQNSQNQQLLILSTMDNDFIHLATEDQLDHVISKFWHNLDFIVLKVSTNDLNGRLLYETNPGGSSKYYHLYEGNIPVDSIVAVIGSS